MHVKGHVRELFEGFAEAGLFADEATTLDTILTEEGSHIFDVGLLIGSLWNCADIMPQHLREQLQEERGWEDEPYTYAQAVQRLHAELPRD